MADAILDFTTRQTTLVLTECEADTVRAMLRDMLINHADDGMCDSVVADARAVVAALSDPTVV